jgi:hypothetical protein
MIRMAIHLSVSGKGLAQPYVECNMITAIGLLFSVIIALQYHTPVTVFPHVAICTVKR